MSGVVAGLAVGYEVIGLPGSQAAGGSDVVIDTAGGAVLADPYGLLRTSRPDGPCRSLTCPADLPRAPAGQRVRK
jgi:hypothetical protein